MESYPITFSRCLCNAKDCCLLPCSLDFEPLLSFFFLEAIFLVKRNFVSLRFVQMIRTSVPYFRDRLSFQPQFKCSIRYFFLLLERDTSTSLR